MDRVLVQAVRARASGVCEYCRIPEMFYPAPFAVDHVIARQHGGPTTVGNLALACLHCNGHKGPNIAGLDPVTRKLTPLFHPRRHKWTRHFRLDGAILVGRTAVGRTTVAVLNMNDPPLLGLRRELISEGMFSPLA